MLKVDKNKKFNNNQDSNAIDVLFRSYDEKENQAALNTIFNILMQDNKPISLADNARINDYTERVVGIYD